MITTRLQAWGAARAAAALSLASSLPGQAPATLQVDHAVYGFSACTADGDVVAAGAGGSVVDEVPPGAIELRFGMGGGGRPMPLTLAVPSGADIVAAVAPAPDPEAPVARLAASVTGTRVFGVGDAGEAVRRDVAVRARVRPVATSGVLGLVCRWAGEDDHYRLVWDCAAELLRVERRLGGQVVELARAAAPVADGRWHALELQVDGFRLQALCDDRTVALVMDGALSEGGYGTYAESDAPTASAVEFVEVAAAVPAQPTASLAAQTLPGHTEVVGNAPVAASSLFAVVLRFDRPTAVWPTDPNGFEPALNVRMAEPLLFLRGACGEVSHSGELRAGFSWPQLPALHGQAALVGALIGTPDGGALQARLPWAAVRF